VNRKELFLRACRMEPTERVPVWMMRQAGRYLPEYRALRAKHDFLTVCGTPELAAEVSLQPYRRLDVDAVIVFSDILIPARAMGMDLHISDAGPVLQNPIRDVADLARLKSFDPEQETGFLNDAIRLLCRELGPEIPVLGFAGAPWTLACYMVQGQTKSGFDAVKRMMYSSPTGLRRLLNKIAGVTVSYLRAQISAGAAAVQLFDTWAGELSTADYDAFALPAVREIVAGVADLSAPLIYYLKGSHHLFASAATAGADVLSVDWREDLAATRAAFPHLALQGNIDPCILLGPEDYIARSARSAVAQTGGRGHILNLGHGILPSTPVESARVFVEAGKSFALAAGAVR